MGSEGTSFGLQGSVWMTVGGETFGGPGRVDLLAAIGETGSISQAAKALGVSYKGAWDAIDAMNNLAGEALVERATGGKLDRLEPANVFGPGLPHRDTTRFRSHGTAV